jgi:hypothetical protein
MENLLVSEQEDRFLTDNQEANKEPLIDAGNKKIKDLQLNTILTNEKKYAKKY